MKAGNSSIHIITDRISIIDIWSETIPEPGKTWKVPLSEALDKCK